MELSYSTIVSAGSRLRNVSNFMILAFSVPLVGVAASTTYGQSCDHFLFRICIGIFIYLFMRMCVCVYVCMVVKKS
jgi:hypothetical protein